MTGSVHHVICESSQLQKEIQRSNFKHAESTFDLTLVKHEALYRHAPFPYGMSKESAFHIVILAGCSRKLAKLTSS